MCICQFRLKHTHSKISHVLSMIDEISEDSDLRGACKCCLHPHENKEDGDAPVAALAPAPCLLS